MLNKSCLNNKYWLIMIIYLREQDRCMIISNINKDYR
jgi:hypothetical protein